jgi:hypothetical protein
LQKKEEKNIQGASDVLLRKEAKQHEGEAF